MAKFEKLHRVNVEVSNADDTSRKYAITAEAQIGNGKVESVSNGQVREGDKNIASFSRWADNNMNVTFNNVAKEAQCDVLTEINVFVGDVETLAQTQTINF